MDKIRKRLRKLADEELRTVSKAIDRELKRRLMQTGDVADDADQDHGPRALPMRAAVYRSRRLRRAA